MLKTYYHHGSARSDFTSSAPTPPVFTGTPETATGDPFTAKLLKDGVGSHVTWTAERRLASGADTIGTYHQNRFYAGCVDRGSLPRGEMSARSTTVPRKLRVTRGDYKAVVASCSTTDELFTIVGPTGCGKSTFALLPLMSRGTVLIVCPTAANAANLLSEFNDRMPPVARAFRNKHPVPRAAYFKFTSFVDSPFVLSVCVASDFARAVGLYRCFPPVDYIVVDEYHLNIEPVVIVRNLVSCCRNPKLKQRVYLVSATPPDEPPPRPRLGDLTVVDYPSVDSLRDPVPMVLRRVTHRAYGNNYLLVVVANCTAAHALHDRLADLGESVFCLCVHASVESVWDDFRAHISSHTVIVTPDTEAGITVPASIMVNCGTTDRVYCDRGVVYPEETGLGPAANVQRMGRAGRVCHTVVYNCKPGARGGTDQASPLHATVAYLHVTRACVKAVLTPDLKLAAATYPKLSGCTPALACACLAAVSPVAALFNQDKDGKRYREFGGDATTFVADNASSFNLYSWAVGGFFSPFLDLTADIDPASYCPASATQAIAEHLLDAQPNLPPASSLVDEPGVDFRPLAPGVWAALRTFEGNAPLTVGSDPSPYKPLSASLGALGQQLFDLCSPAFSFECKVSTAGDKASVSHWLSYGDSQINIDFTKCWRQIPGQNGWEPDSAKVKLALDRALRPSYAMIVAKRGGRAIELKALRRLQGRLPNTWFNELEL